MKKMENPKALDVLRFTRSDKCITTIMFIAIHEASSAKKIDRQRKKRAQGKIKRGAQE